MAASSEIIVKKLIVHWSKKNVHNSLLWLMDCFHYVFHYSIDAVIIRVLPAV